MSKLTEKQIGVLHYLKGRNCPEANHCRSVASDSSKRHGPQVRRQGLRRTIASLQRRGLVEFDVKYQWYKLTEAGEAVEGQEWEKR